MGNLLGRDQSGGNSSQRLLRVTTDADLIVDAHMSASLIIDDDSGFVPHPAIRETLDMRLRAVEAELLKSRVRARPSLRWTSSLLASATT